MKYYLIAGEASGDLHASNLMKSIKAKDPQAEFRYFGGDLMQAQGGTLVKHYREMAYMGFVQVVLHLPQILRNMSLCKADVKAFQPDVVILVDYPSFNLKMAKYVKTQLGIPVHYYISPKLWAWKTYRIKSMKAYVDKVWSIFPFEPPFFAQYDYEVTYVGNPTVDELLKESRVPLTQREFNQRHGLDDRPIVALLAGSRRAEVRSNLLIMLEAMRRFPDYQVVIAGAPGLDQAFYDEVLGETPAKVVFNQTYDVLKVARFALVTSGTATLEAGVMGTPQVVCYHLGGGRLLYTLMQRLLKVDYVSLVNLIVNRPLVCELLGYRLTPESLAQAIGELLEPAQYEQVKQGYQEMIALLGEEGAADQAAQAIVCSLT